MLTLFFVEDLPTTVGATYEFNNDDANHAIRVLRIGTGEIFNLSDGAGSWSRVQVLTVAKKSMQVKVVETGHQDALDTHFTVIQAIPKGDRIKESIELSTAGGADVILLWAATRSIGKGTPDLMQKLATTAREASKQTRRHRIPFVMGVLDAKKIAAEIPNYDLAIIFHESAAQKLTDVVKPGAKKVLLIIGPEGGISDSELSVLEGAGAHIVGLGPEVFRSAHAGGAALSAVSALIGRW